MHMNTLNPYPTPQLTPTIPQHTHTHNHIYPNKKLKTNWYILFGMGMHMNILTTPPPPTHSHHPPMHTHTHMHTHTYTYAQHTRTHTRTHMYTHTHTHTDAHTQNLHVHTHTQVIHIHTNSWRQNWPWPDEPGCRAAWRPLWQQRTCTCGDRRGPAHWPPLGCWREQSPPSPPCQTDCRQSPSHAGPPRSNSPVCWIKSGAIKFLCCCCGFGMDEWKCINGA